MSKLLFAFTVLLSTVVFARPEYPNVSGQVFGGWIGPAFEQNGFALHSKLYFNQNSLLVSNTCSFGGMTLEVEVSGRASYTTNTVSSMSRAENTVTNNGLDCTSSIEPMTFNYIVTGNVLTLIVQGQSMNLNREL